MARVRCGWSWETHRSDASLTRSGAYSTTPNATDHKLELTPSTLFSGQIEGHSPRLPSGTGLAGFAAAPHSGRTIRVSSIGRSCSRAGDRRARGEGEAALRV